MNDNDYKEYNTVILENNIEYAEIEKIVYNGNIYLILANTNEPSDLCIRKLITENDKKIMIGLDSDEKVKEILNLFAKKYTN